MFNGIIQNTGKVKNINGNSIGIITPMDLKDCVLGSSISCDGICLTINKLKKYKSFYEFNVEISDETFLRSTIKYWKKNRKINLEKSLKFNQGISGHLVYGHIDGISKLMKVKKKLNNWNMFFEYTSKKQKHFFAEKGSISLNGISLTIANILDRNFSVSIIPYTFENTNLSNLKINDAVNVEFDMLARYIFNK